MGVMACNRRNCDNIMCNRTILRRKYYICDECFDELMNLKKVFIRIADTQDPEIFEEESIKEGIEEFMDTEKMHYFDGPLSEKQKKFEDIFNHLTNC